MNQHGRKSLSSVVAIPTEIKRFEPDPEMPAEQREIWLRVVASRPQDWFDEVHRDMLTSYVRHVAYGDRLARALDEVRSKSLTDPTRLLQIQRLHTMHRYETAAAERLATKMRITHQSLNNIVAARKMQNFQPGGKPWQKDAS
jgi:hypothetical protein